MSRKSTIDRLSARTVSGLQITRDSLREISRISVDTIDSCSDQGDRNSWKLSYLREQFYLQGLEELFCKYTNRINEVYFSLFVLLQIFLTVIHTAIILYFNFQSDSLNIVFVDLICYGLITLLCILISCCRLHQRPPYLRILPFLAYTVLVGVNLFLPLYSYYGLGGISNRLRPSYTTHITIVCYVVSSYQKIVRGMALGAFAAFGHMLVVGFVSYAGSEMLWKRLVSEGVYLLCVNAFGIYLHFTHELAKRRTFLDRRACVEFTIRLKYEEEQKEQLLSSIIPEHAIKEVRQHILAEIEYVEKLERLPVYKPFEIPYMQKHENVSILYADIVNYTAMTSKLPVITLVETLNELFGGFDDASEDLNVLRIKFLGDCYYCVAGLLPDSTTNHAEACIDLGLRMISIIGVVRERRNLEVNMRIGVHSGKILSGLIGSTKWQFDIWSKDVIIANKMETTGEPGKVHITKQTLNLIKKHYNIQATSKGSTNPILLPYSIETFLISPPSGYQDCDTPKVSATLPRTKRLSILAESSDQVDKGNPILLNMMQRVWTTSKFGESDAVSHRESIFGFRRDSSLGARRQSGNSQIHRKGNVRRFTPGDIQRRTAFMNSHLNQYHDCLKTTDRSMEEAIEKMPLTKYEQWFKVKDIHPLFLTFKNLDMQLRYFQLPDHLFKYYLLGVLALLIGTIVIQNLAVLDWDWDNTWLSYETVLIMLIFLVPLTWLQYLFPNFSTSNKVILRTIYTISSYTTENVIARTLIYFLACGLYMACIFVPLDECRTFPYNKGAIALFEVEQRTEKDVPLIDDNCIIPWHLSHILLLNIIMIYLFLRISTCLKLLSSLGVIVLYAIFVNGFPNEFYSNSETYNYMIKPQTAHLMSLVFLTITLHLIDRQNDYLNKLDYLWKQQLKQEEGKTNVMHNVNKMLLKNILPLHVAEIYLDVNRSSKELYHEEYKNVAVMFASVVDYITDDVDDQIFLGIMNQIIREFDLLLLKKTDTIEKIKVTNWTYMAACGLDPGKNGGHDEDDELVCKLGQRNNDHVAIRMLSFAVDMIQALVKLNGEAGQSWKLRIGIAHGEVTAGVVGSKKPLYDIWGDTVNMASRMDSTGVSGKIQVTEETAMVFKRYGIQCDFRDRIFVKGKDSPVPTYFVRLDANHQPVLNKF